MNSVAQPIKQSSNVYIMGYDGRVLDVGLNQNVLMAEKKQAESQLWTFTDDGFVVNVQSKLVLDIEGWGTNVIVHQHKPEKNYNQRWSLTSEGFITSYHKGLALDIDTNSGHNVIVWELHGGLNQQWKLVGKDQTDSNLLYSQVFISSQDGRVLDVQGNNNVIVASKNYSESQFWDIQKDGFIRNVKSKLVLDIDVQRSNIIVYQQKPWDNYNQRWQILPDGFISSYQRGVVLDVQGGGGPNVIAYQLHGGENQKWKIELP